MLFKCLFPKDYVKVPVFCDSIKMAKLINLKKKRLCLLKNIENQNLDSVVSINSFKEL